MHKENGVRVEKCTYASGGITGYVYSGKTRLPIENAKSEFPEKSEQAAAMVETA